MSDAAVAHLRTADPVLAGMIGDLGGHVPQWTPGDPYDAIIRAIVSQQFSTTSARAILGRLQARFGGRNPTPDEVLADDPDALKAVGLSRAKVVSLRSLAEHLTDGSVRLDGDLAHVTDDELIAALTQVKGIGEWTAQIVLVVGLARPDVLVAGDLVIRQAVERGWKLPALPTREELYALAEPWRPHRSRACALLWAWMRAAPTA
jgi:DNA-3-methyladenine glycosylase II